MSGFRRTHRHHKSYSHRFSPLTIVAICLASVLVVSVITGLLLRAALDEETYNRLNAPKGPSVKDPVNTYLPDIGALPFRFDTVTDSIPPAASRAMLINSPDGRMQYTSPVTRFFGIDAEASVTMEEDLMALDVSTTYISGIFYPQAFLQESADLQYATAATERALLREFIRNGGNEVLLIIDSLSAESLKEIASYASALKQDMGESALGIAVPHALTISEDGWEIIGTLLKSCDFCALDLRQSEAEDEDAAGELYGTLGYYLKQYDMRLLLAEEQEILIAALEETDVSDYEIMPLWTSPSDEKTEE